MNLKKLLICILLFSAISCTKNVTTYVPATSAPHDVQQNQIPNTQVDNNSSSGGVINGGGGKGVLCTKNGKQTLEVLDLYEARTIYRLKLLNFGNDQTQAQTKLSELLANHFWNPYTIDIDKFAKSINQEALTKLMTSIIFIEDGTKIKSTHDAYEPILEKNCEVVQIAVYYDESVLIVDKSLWKKLDPTNKMALLAHESMYYLARESGTTNSISTRKFVGMLFSENGVQPLADKVPKSNKQFIYCRIESHGFWQGNFFLFSSENEDKERGLEAVFSNFGSDNSLFRKSMFINNLTFQQLQFPNFTKKADSLLIKDTYPVRDRLSIQFNGISNNELNATLNILQGAQMSVAATLDVRCPFPKDVSLLEERSTKAGYYEAKQPNGETDKLSINEYGYLTLEQSRQVGQLPGGANEVIVPYPTYCRYKQSGTITSIDSEKIQYLILKIELIDGFENTDKCQTYITEVNRRASFGTYLYSIDKKYFNITD